MVTIPTLAQFLLLAPLVFSPCAASGVEREAPSVELEALDGSVQTRELRGLYTKDPRELGGHLVRFRGFASSQELRGPGAQVDLVTGDRLIAAVKGGDGEELSLELFDGLAFNVMIEDIERLVFPERLSGVIGRVEPADEGDRLYRRRGAKLERIDGTLEEFSNAGVAIESLVGRKQVPWEEVAALFVDAFGDLDTETDTNGSGRPEGVQVVCDLIHHSRLRGRLVELNQEVVRIATQFGAELEVPCRYIRELLIDDGQLRFLSELVPDSAREGSPFGDEIGMSWPHRRDLAVTGDRLSVGGRFFARGIGVHAPSRLTWKLDGSYSHLFGLVAIDDSVARLAMRGSVRFRVLVDGELRYESPVVRYGDPQQELPPIDLSGATELTLEAGMATDFFQGDRANWLRMRLVR